MQPSATAYDDSFRTLLNDCRELIIPVVNDAFDENYTGREEIILMNNEQFLIRYSGDIEKRITDASFIIVRADGTRKRYHIECESRMDNSILVRIFEYDAQIALTSGELQGDTFTVSFPHSAVLALRHTSTTPNTMHIRVVTPGGEIFYDVPVIKVQHYSLAEIFERKLLFFLPFYIFNHEKHLPEYESDEEKLRKLTDEYRSILARLDALQEAGDLDSFTKHAICATINHVMELIADNYENVREGVKDIMGGKIIDYEAKTIRNAARNEGISIGRNEGISIGRNEGINIGLDRGRNEGIGIGLDRGLKLATEQTEERAKDMLRDKMSMSLVEKYTHLSMPRIQELARGLGML